jgi:hypothetical protein
MRFSLEFEPEVDFEMLSISSHLRDYKLCWNLNRIMGMNLSKCAPLEYNRGKKKEPTLHARYIWHDEETHTSYHLVKNKAEDGLLVPELKHADYILFVRDNIHINFTGLIANIRKIDNVMMAQKIDPLALKNVEHLMYLEFETH